MQPAGSQARRGRNDATELTWKSSRGDDSARIQRAESSAPARRGNAAVRRSPPERVLIGSLIALLFLTDSLTDIATAKTNRPSETISARIEQARAERKIDARLNALGNIGRNLSLADIPDVLKAAETLKSLRDQLALMDTTVKRWGELAPADAFAHIAALPEGLTKVEAIRSVAVAYAKLNSPAAATAALKMKPGRARSEAVSLIAETWAQSDVNAALKWAKASPDGSLKQAALRSIYFVWVHSEPIAASSVVQNLTAGEMRNALLMNVAANWAVTDPQAAIRWAKALPVEADQDLATVIAVESWADSDPLAAGQFAAKLMPQSLKQRAVLATVERWAMQDPQQAFEWISKTADRSFYEPGIARVLTVCAPVRPEAASKWVEQLPVGPIRDGAIGTYVESASAWHPEAAARLAFKTSDPTQRQQRVEPCFRSWLASDPESAKRWIKETDFHEELKHTWLSAESTLEF